MSLTKSFIVSPLKRVIDCFRWRLGLAVISPQLQRRADEAITGFYGSRITQSDFLSESEHYERPRAEWILSKVAGGLLLEIGCGSGGMTALLSPKVKQIVALDISAGSLQELEKKGLNNVRTVLALIETASLVEHFDWIIMSEVIEHLRQPDLIVKKCFDWLAPGGSMLLTTPNGHWESNEHLHKFTLQSLTEMLIQSGAETISSGFLRDSADRRRWIFGQISKPIRPPAKDWFHNHFAVAKMRRLGHL